MQQTQQTFEFIETLNDALGALVRALGGPKKVGTLLKPERPEDEAKNWVNSCLDRDREVFFHPEQVQLMLRAAKKKGFHGAINFVCADADYAAPVPLEPEDDKEKLARDFIKAIEQDRLNIAQQTLNIERLEQLAKLGIRIVA